MLTNKQVIGLSVYNGYYGTSYSPKTLDDFYRMYGDLATRSHILGSGHNHTTSEERKKHVLECLEGWADNEYMKTHKV